MSPEEFEAKMKELRDKYEKSDTEKAILCEETHIGMDKLMCQALIECGYSAGVKIFNDTEKWYS